jgi:hypothetical protein
MQNSGTDFFLRNFDDGDGTIFGFNLKLRWKFLAILLVFSLTPPIVVTIISQQKMTLP